MGTATGTRGSQGDLFAPAGVEGDRGSGITDLASYDHVVVATSGGKDGLACLLTLLDMGVPAGRIELWHHHVDGMEGSTLMDWPVTSAYVRALATAFGTPLHGSWRHGGIEGEMLRVDAPAAPVSFEVPGGATVTRGGASTQRVTRLRFPQTSSATKGRWCSAAVKIDVGNVALRNQDRFNGARTLFVTGERAEESPGRARYPVLQRHDCDLRDSPRLRRHVDHWRPVHAMTEAGVWALIARHKVNPHPAYALGVGRVSCMFCVFADKDQLATLRAFAPGPFGAIAGYERRFGSTVRHGATLDDVADGGTPYAEATREAMARCMSTTFDEPVFVDPWRLPAGAFRGSGGPT